MAQGIIRCITFISLLKDELTFFNEEHNWVSTHFLVVLKKLCNCNYSKSKVWVLTKIFCRLFHLLYLCREKEGLVYKPHSGTYCQFLTHYKIHKFGPQKLIFWNLAFLVVFQICAPNFSRIFKFSRPKWHEKLFFWASKLMKIILADF